MLCHCDTLSGKVSMSRTTLHDLGFGFLPDKRCVPGVQSHRKRKPGGADPRARLARPVDLRKRSGKWSGHVA
jgi:hypothetical protein